MLYLLKQVSYCTLRDQNDRNHPLSRSRSASSLAASSLSSCSNKESLGPTPLQPQQAARQNLALTSVELIQRESITENDVRLRIINGPAYAPTLTRWSKQDEENPKQRHKTCSKPHSQSSDDSSSSAPKKRNTLSRGMVMIKFGTRSERLMAKAKVKVQASMSRQSFNTHLSLSLELSIKCVKRLVTSTFFEDI